MIIRGSSILICARTNTYMHIYIHTYIHTYLYTHACVHTCRHAYARAYIHAYRFTDIQTQRNGILNNIKLMIYIFKKRMLRMYYAIGLVIMLSYVKAHV